MLKAIEKGIRKFFPKRIADWKNIANRLKNKKGLEIGGPSFAFTKDGFLPVYDYVKDLDGCNFSTNTVWEGNISEGNNYNFGDRKGFQHISDGSDLHKIEDGHYDFILSCHSIEHIANPIKALKEWKRVIKNEGYMLLIVPHKDQTFDHKRPVTTLEHLIDDFNNKTEETDTTHFQEVNTLHDISKDEGINDSFSLKERTKDNFNNRCVHHHVFNSPLLVKLADYLHLRVITLQHFNPFHIVILLKKEVLDNPDNSFYLNTEQAVYQKPNYPSDRIWNN